MDNALANPLLEDSNPLANTAANDLATDRPARLSSDMTYDQFLDWYQGSGIQGQYNSYRESKGWDEWTGDSAPPYERNEAGRYVNENGEELFYYTGPDYETEYKNGAGLNADADYMTMADIEAKYNEDTVLSNVFDSVEDYKAYIVERQDLIDQGVIMDKWEKENQLWNDPFFRRQDGRGGPNKDAMADILKAETARREGAERDAYAQLNDKYGVETTITDTNGNTLVWNGSGYSLKERYKEDDKWGNKLAWAAAGYILTAGLAPALAGSLGAAGSKAAASAISNLATQFVQSGEVDWESAILSAATAYGGAQLSDALAGSGVVGQLGSQITEFGDSIMSGGGNILQSALQAGGMSLVTQLVKDGDIDWKDAAIAAAIGGGTAALQGFLSDIGKSDAEGDVLEEITVTAKHKGTLVGEDMYQLDNGTVIYAPADGDTSVLGNMSDLDLNGDGQLTGNDLQEIQANNYEFKDPNPFENGTYVDYDGGGNAFREGGTYYISEDGVVHQRGDVTYIDGDPNGTYLVKDAQGNEFYVRNAKFTAEGRFVDESGNYVAVNGYYDGATGNVYDNIEDYTSPNAITDNTDNQTEFTYGRNPNWNNDPNYRGTVYGGEGAFGVNGEMDIFYDPVTNTYYTSNEQGNAVEIDVEELPKEIQNQLESESGGGAQNGAGTNGLNGDPNTGISANPSTPSTGGPSSSGSFTPEQLANIANLAGSTVQEIIDRLDSGETVQEILTANGTSPIANNGANTNNNGGATNPPETSNNGTDANTGNPNPSNNPNLEAYEARIADLMARGMTREEAEANQAHALKLGADLDGDGIVYDAEWFEYKGSEANSGNNNSGNSANGTSNNTNTNTNGNTQGNNNGGNENGNPNNTGAGENNTGNGGDGIEGDGNNVGDGDEDGEGDNDGDGHGPAFGNGLGGNGMLSGAGDRTRPTWGPLFPATPFRPKPKAKPSIGRRLFDELFRDNGL